MRYHYFVINKVESVLCDVFEIIFLQRIIKNTLKKTTSNVTIFLYKT